MQFITTIILALVASFALAAPIPTGGSGTEGTVGSSTGTVRTQAPVLRTLMGAISQGNRAMETVAGRDGKLDRQAEILKQRMALRTEPVRKATSGGRQGNP